MDRIEIGMAGVAITLLLLAVRTPIGVTLGIVAFVGIWILTSLSAAWSIVTAIPFDFITNWNLSAVPTFLLMGYVASATGLTKGLFASIRMFFGRVPGGLASSTVLASAMFASASGSSVATAAAFSRIAVPEMLKSKYDPGLATGAVAASGTLGSLIPPSILMILFGIFTDTSVGALFLAGVIPGIISAGIYIGMITVRSSLNPSLAPPHNETYTRAEKIQGLKEIWPLPTLIVFVLGGIFVGVFSPTEAGAVGAFLAMVIAGFRGTLNWPVMKKALVETAEGTSTTFIIALGAVMFVRFLGLSTLPEFVAEVLLPVTDSPVYLIAMIAVLYVVLGMFVDPMSLMLLTLPIVLPLTTSLGIDMVWFGIIVIKLLEIGLITPPVGLCVYVMKTSLGDQVSLSVMFKGVFWFLAMDVLTLTILVAFPILSLWLPSLAQ
ncbi:TRAP transporter large permease [Granulosicoccus antarcticus]|uniref:TRAP transporter large permease protein n=1 Tax=Granulosicoccus antarcticus IMCC3135 TaxID=1192854 RepID=A0A2Z2NUR4_9GAMM|nr:TRAP transporter large permease [Granulosicoccus antarcticus]ASJ73468.1 Sialic acid TRAP transporter permease protein SiaT [Granulosicoccus antarcticus IMCC3135]